MLEPVSRTYSYRVTLAKRCSFEECEERTDNSCDVTHVTFLCRSAVPQRLGNGQLAKTLLWTSDFGKWSSPKPIGVVAGSVFGHVGRLEKFPKPKFKVCRGSILPRSKWGVVTVASTALRTSTPKSRRDSPVAASRTTLSGPDL